MIERSRIKIIIAILMVLIVVTLVTSPLSADTKATIYGQFFPSPPYAQSDIKAVYKVWGDLAFFPDVRIEFFTPQGNTTGCYRPEGGGKGATFTTNTAPMVSCFGSPLSFIFLDNNVPPGPIRLLLTTALITTNTFTIVTSGKKRLGTIPFK